jgi:CheY-like chemotaxis protein
VKKTILAIDDDPTFLRWLDLQLQTEGFNVLTASSGLDAINMIKQSSVQLVITDMRMPVVDGYDVIYALKELYPETPIILTTSNTVNERVRSALRFEGVGLLRKPLTIASLENAIRDLAPSLLKAPPQQSAA